MFVHEDDNKKNMQKGYNSDIVVRGQKYHIQTEDWGQGNPFVVSRIFCNGAVMKTIKTPYSRFLNSGSTIIEDAVRAAIKDQHSGIIDTLMGGGTP